MTRRIGQFLAVCLLPTIAALWMTANLPGGSIWPWEPRTEDLWVYREAALYLLEGRDFYQLEDAFPYIYPPIAAVLAIPLALVPWWTAQLLWTMLNVAIIVAVLRHLRIGAPWVVSFGATVTILFVRPVTSTLHMGQLGVLLLGLVVLDAVDGPRLFRGGDRRVVPAGVLTGIATGLKLTPAVFIVHYFLTRRFRQGFVALGTFLATVVVGLIVSPAFSPGYWLRLAGGDSGANPDAYGWINNISVLSAVYRFTDVTTVGTIVGLGTSALLVLAALVAAWLSRRAGRDLLGISILGMVSCVANPIAWMHHLTWVVPLIVAGVRDRLPVLVRWSVLIGALWCILQPQFALGGAPWAQREIHEYTVAQKVLAAGPDIVVALMVVCVLLTLWRPADAVAPTTARHAADDRDATEELPEVRPKRAWTDGVDQK
ncbi:glycosyltransferase family 87 protein [Granulicoccus sp. GXG6511]|uniref:glycosyltransferase family 87 protein n=1 Tax=Granulicoccus sp. GXG6511 TaxID=3381351 RepID=UPI003D7D60B0